MNARDAGSLLGVAIDRKPLDQLVDDALDAITRRGPRVTFACANPHSLVTAQEDSFFLRALNHASHVVADGVGVLMMARMAGIEVGPRITGSDFFSGVMESLERRGGGRVFFFGSSQRVLDLIAERCVREYPHVIVCGMLSPPYRQWSDEENEAMLMQINNARPDVLWVGMTAPKQEKWVEANQGRLHRRSIRFLSWHLPACAAVDVPRRHRVAVSIAQGAAAHVAPESHLFSLVRIVGSASPPIPLACLKKLRRGLHVSSDDARAFAPVPLGDAAVGRRRPGRRLDVLGRTHLSRQAVDRQRGIQPRLFDPAGRFLSIVAKQARFAASRLSGVVARCRRGVGRAGALSARRAQYALYIGAIFNVCCVCWFFFC